MRIPLLLLVLLLAACSDNLPRQEQHFYLIQPERREDMPAENQAGPALRVGRVGVAAPFDGRAWLYRRDDVRFETDFYNQFAADPADMVAEAAANWLRSSGLFPVVLPVAAAGTPPYRLEADISALYVDFQGEPAAVLKLRWQLVRESDRVSLLSIDCDERVRLANRSPEAVARAYRQALGKALRRLEGALAAARLS